MGFSTIADLSALRVTRRGLRNGVLGQKVAYRENPHLWPRLDDVERVVRKFHAP